MTQCTAASGISIHLSLQVFVEVRRATKMIEKIHNEPSFMIRDGHDTLH